MGERAVLLFQNLHRYTFYASLLLLVFLWEEGLLAFFKDGRFGVGVGTIVMVMNAALLSAYTFGCHSCRHLIGGRHDCLTCSSARYGMWKAIVVAERTAHAVRLAQPGLGVPDGCLHLPGRSRISSPT